MLVRPTAPELVSQHSTNCLYSSYKRHDIVEQLSYLIRNWKSGRLHYGLLWNQVHIFQINISTCKHVSVQTCKHDNINAAWLACLPLVSTTVAKILGARVSFFPTLFYNLTGTLSKETASQPPHLSPSLSGLSCLGHCNYSEGHGEEFTHKSLLFQGSECNSSPFPKIPRHPGFRAPKITGLHKNSQILRFKGCFKVPVFRLLGSAAG